MIYGSFTTSELIEEVKKRAFLPSAQNTLDDNDILGYINTEMYDSIVAHVLMYHQEFFAFPVIVPIVANQNEYTVPYRAIGRKLRDIKYMDSYGNLFNMTRIMPEDRSYFQETGFNPYKAFYFQGDQIILMPGVGDLPTGSLVEDVFLRPNELVLETRACTVSSFDTTTNIITVSGIPSNITTGSLIDFIAAHPGHRTLKFDVLVTNIDPVNNLITIDPTTGFSPVVPTQTFLPANIGFPPQLQIGDFINTAQESIIPQIPQELQSLLAERGAARCLASLGHTENLQASNAKIKELEDKSGSLIDNRSEGAPIKLNNLGGILRLSKVARRRFYF